MVVNSLKTSKYCTNFSSKGEKCTKKTPAEVVAYIEISNYSQRYFWRYKQVAANKILRRMKITL
jgi:hypothetical protein